MLNHDAVASDCIAPLDGHFLATSPPFSVPISTSARLHQMKLPSNTRSRLSVLTSSCNGSEPLTNTSATSRCNFSPNQIHYARPITQHCYYVTFPTSSPFSVQLLQSSPLRVKSVSREFLRQQLKSSHFKLA